MKPLCVLKLGGSLVDSEETVGTLTAQLIELAQTERVVIVHGGGPQATRMALQYGHRPIIVEGRRVTSALDLEIIQASVCGIVNSQLVAALVGSGLPAVGMSGASAGTVSVTKRPPWEINGETVDFGLVGDIDAIDPTLVVHLLGEGYMPVVATIGIDQAGALYNVNADTTASALAVALRADRFCIVTDSGGVQKNGQAVAECDPDAFLRGKADGWVTGGMLVKLTAGFSALDQGVHRVEIVGHDGILEGNGTRLLRSPVAVEEV